MSRFGLSQLTRDELDASVPFNPKRHLGGPGGEQLLARAVAGLLAWEAPRKRARRAADLEHLHHAADALLANLLAALRNRVSSDIFVAVPFDGNYYAGTDLTLVPMQLVRDFLLEERLAEGQSGYYRAGQMDGALRLGHARRSRMRATGKLIAQMREAGIDLQAPVRTASSGLGPSRAEDIIQMSDPQPSAGDEPPEVEASRRVIEATNRLNLSATIELPDAAWSRILQRRPSSTDSADRLGAGDATRVALYRKFVRTWLEGGRLYGGWWQTVPKSERAHLTIDGQPTVELDYARLHPTILYAQRGLVLDEDPYAVPDFDGPDMRELGKRTFNRLLNGKAVRLRPDAQDLSQLAPGVQFDAFVEALRAKHLPIADAFGSKVSAQLQRVDSDIIVEVLRRTSDADVPALPIHDSVIVPETEEALARAAMSEAYRQVVGEEPGPIQLVGLT